MGSRDSSGCDRGHALNPHAKCDARIAYFEERTEGLPIKAIVMDETIHHVCKMKVPR